MHSNDPRKERRRQLRYSRFLELRAVGSLITKHDAIAALLTHRADYEAYERLEKNKRDHQQEYNDRFRDRNPSSSQEKKLEQEIAEYDARIADAQAQYEASFKLEQALFDDDIETVIFIVLGKYGTEKRAGFSYRKLGANLIGFHSKKPAITGPEKKAVDAARNRLIRKLDDIEKFGLFEIRQPGGPGSNYHIAASKLLLEIDRDIFEPEIDALLGSVPDEEGG